MLNGELMLQSHESSNGETRLVANFSRDGGRSWRASGTIARADWARADLGDGNAVVANDGTIYACFRRNRAPKRYEIGVSFSKDRGATWTELPSVQTYEPQGEGPSRGLWAPSLFLTRSGELLCVYDDEGTPFDRGFPGHQWLMMRRWRPAQRQWSSEVTVARAKNRTDLSRDGMASFVETEPDHLICAFESVRTAPPHQNVIRTVESRNGGRNWSWSEADRPIAYSAPDPRFGVVSPWLMDLGKGNLLLIFGSNEARSTPIRSGTPAHELQLEIRLSQSRDGGKSWSPSMLIAGGVSNYLPGLMRDRKGTIFATWLDFEAGPKIAQLVNRIPG